MSFHPLAWEALVAPNRKEFHWALTHTHMGIPGKKKQAAFVSCSRPHTHVFMQVARVRAARCLYVAHALLASSRPLEALALFERAVIRVREAAAEDGMGSGAPAAGQPVLDSSDMARLGWAAEAYR